MLLGCMLLAAGVVAQTFHYNSTRTFREAGFTYQANVSAGGMVTLFNANNRHDPNLRQTFRDGTPLLEEPPLLGQFLVLPLPFRWLRALYGMP